MGLFTLVVEAIGALLFGVGASGLRELEILLVAKGFKLLSDIFVGAAPIDAPFVPLYDNCFKKSISISLKGNWISVAIALVALIFSCLIPSKISNLSTIN